MGMVKTDNLCNYCRVRNLRQVAEAHGRYLRLREGEMDGVNAYEVPDCTQYYNLKPGTSDHDKYFKEWFDAVPDHCVC